MKIWAHTLVKNEEKYLWYAVSSVIKHVDKLLLWDTGSTDGSLRIAKGLKEKFSEKIDLKQVTLGGAEEFPKIRQKMLDVTDANWFIMVDGDEVWWEGSIRKVVETIETYSKEAESIVVPTVYP
ncbi:MAG: Glycosyl transferase family 2, partial [Candidatus Woesebacteria bacterium GW2011_GWB1_40_101]